MIYLIVFLILFWLAYIHDIAGNTQNRNIHLLFEMLILISLAGLRNLMGSDTYQYTIFWDLLPTQKPLITVLQTFRYEYGWTLICFLFKKTFGSFIFFQFFVAFTLNYSIYRIIKKRAKYPFVILLLYYITGYRYFFMNFEFMRESLSTAVFLLWGIGYFEKKEYIKYFIICLICSMIHSSGILLFGLPVVNLIKYSSTKAKLFIAIIMLSLIVFPVFLMDQLENVLLFILPEKIIMRIVSNMLSSEHIGDPWFFMAHMYPYLLYLICVWILAFIKKQESIYIKYLYYSLIILCFMPIILDAYRSVGYLFVLVFIPFSEFFVEVLLKKRKIFYPIAIIGYVMLINVFFFRHIFEKDILFEYYPYISVFENNTNEQKQYMRFRQNDNTTLYIQIYNN